MTLAQASALIAAGKAAGPRMYAYVMLSLRTGVRTEEARALLWQHVDFGYTELQPPPVGVAIGAGQSASWLCGTAPLYWSTLH